MFGFCKKFLFPIFPIEAMKQFHITNTWEKLKSENSFLCKMNSSVFAKSPKMVQGGGEWGSMEGKGEGVSKTTNLFQRLELVMWEVEAL